MEGSVRGDMEIVKETVEGEISRFERVISAFEKYMEREAGEMRGIVVKEREEHLKWRSDFEDETTNKLLEIHNALKLL